MNLQLSRTSDYAIRMMVLLAGQPADRPVSRADMAEQQGIPLAYLEKILPPLSRAGLVTARRGPRGGFLLAKPARQVTLLAVIEAVDGPVGLNLCVMAGGRCERSSRCTVHRVWRIAQRQLEALLDETTLAQLACELGGGDPDQAWYALAGGDATRRQPGLECPEVAAEPARVGPRQPR